MLTRAAYSMIASVVADMPAHAPSLRSARLSVYNSFVEKLAADNPRFDRFRFKLACNIDEEGAKAVVNKADEG